jgi:uncharacterized protein YprB with RNaseH-like and TPR domain
LIRGALQQFPGLGPERLKRLAEEGITDWLALREHLGTLGWGPAARDKLIVAIDACEQAVLDKDFPFLTRAFAARDHWRILGTYPEDAAYFDIETSGLEVDSHITLIAAEYRGDLTTYLFNENLDDFLDLIEDVGMLVSFNGASFDVPRVLGQFHIPKLNCGHIDLRWLCYHDELRGGLKSIERTLDITRPDDLHGVDGEEAVMLWRLWEDREHRGARERLIRYCCADVLALKLLTARLLEARSCPFPCPPPEVVWRGLDVAPAPAAHPAHPTPVAGFGDDSPMRLRLERHWRRRRGR